MDVPVPTNISRHPGDCSLPPGAAGSILERRSKLCGKLLDLGTQTAGLSAVHLLRMPNGMQYFDRVPGSIDEQN